MEKCASSGATMLRNSRTRFAVTLFAGDLSRFTHDNDMRGPKSIQIVMWIIREMQLIDDRPSAGFASMTTRLA
jgi:hypothetical protein